MTTKTFPATRLSQKVSHIGDNPLVLEWGKAIRKNRDEYKRLLRYPASLNLAAGPALHFLEREDSVEQME